MSLRRLHRSGKDMLCNRQITQPDEVFEKGFCAADSGTADEDGVLKHSTENECTHAVQDLA